MWTGAGALGPGDRLILQSLKDQPASWGISRHQTSTRYVNVSRETGSSFFCRDPGMPVGQLASRHVTCTMRTCPDQAVRARSAGARASASAARDREFTKKGRPFGRPFAALPACKPNSVCLPAAAARGREIIIYLGPVSPPASSSLPASHFDGPPYPLQERCCLTLHPMGFAWPLRLPAAPVGSYPTISPIACASKTRGVPETIGWFAFCCTCRHCREAVPSC